MAQHSDSDDDDKDLIIAANTYLDFTMSKAGGSDGKASACSVGEPGSIPGLGKSPGEGNGNPLQYSSCLENLMNRGAWWAAVHGVAKSQVRHD